MLLKLLCEKASVHAKTHRKAWFRAIRTIRRLSSGPRSVLIHRVQENRRGSVASAMEENLEYNTISGCEKKDLGTI